MYILIYVCVCGFSINIPCNQSKPSDITWFLEEARQTEQIIIKLQKKGGL